MLFIVPFYAVLAIAMGQLNRLFESPIAVWNPLALELGERHQRLARPGRQRARSPARSSSGRSSTWPWPRCCRLLIAYPAAYFVARFAGRRKGLFLVLLIAPFWISYMMRMLAWVDLLQTNGYVNKALLGLHWARSRSTGWAGCRSR